MATGETFCLFCKLANGIEKSNIIHQTENIACFLDINPINTGHILIVPKKHVVELDELNDLLAIEIMQTSQSLSKALKSLYEPNGITIMQNGGVFNDVGHYHMHIFPRYTSDGFSWVIKEQKSIALNDPLDITNSVSKILSS